MANLTISDGAAGRGALDSVCFPYTHPELFYYAVATVEHYPMDIGKILSHELAHTIGKKENAN